MARRRRGNTLAEIGEDRLLAGLMSELSSSPEVQVGPGDDCAAIRLGGRDWLWTCDAQIEGTHFDRSWMSARQLGRKAYLVNASDVAAMGGAPRFCLVCITAPSSMARRDVLAMQRGMAAAAAADAAIIVGGNIARAGELGVTVSLLAEAPRSPLLRSGAEPGHAIYVSGRLGDAALGLASLRRDRAAKGLAVRKFREPTPRLIAGRVLADERLASAVMDLSDGLLTDLKRLCDASGVGARVEIPRLPMSRAVRAAGVALALSGGEDYELLCAVPAQREDALMSLRDDLGCSMTRVGVFTRANEGLVLVEADGSTRAARAAGFSHFGSVQRPTR